MTSATVVGRLTANPELKIAANGKKVCSFTVADNDGGGDANFIDCVAWENTAEFISNYWAKGKYIAVTGTLRTRSYEDRSGNKRKATEIRVDRAGFCSSRFEGSVPPEAVSTERPITAYEPDATEYAEQEDLPF